MTNSKRELRREYRKRRLQALANHHTLQTVIAQQVLNEIRIRHTRSPFQGHLGLYSPLAGEVDLTALRPSLEGELKLKLALPAADGQGHLSYHAWGAEPLIADGCGIPAPLNQVRLSANQIELLLVPALAVDQKGIRLGYGGGYYDRLRTQPLWRRVPALVVLPGACVSRKALPRDPWDRAFDGWVSEQGVCKVIGSDPSASR